MAKTGSFDVTISPEMQLYKVLQKLSYGEETALSEFIDNSIQSRNDKIHAIQSIDKDFKHLQIDIHIDSRTNTIVIKDNASGINRSDFQRAIRMGMVKGDKHAKDSMSVYGIGMKSAAVWFTDQWTLQTSALGSDEKLTMKFNLQSLLDSGNTELTVKSDPEEQKSHYTEITLTNHIRQTDKEIYRNEILPHIIETFEHYKDSVIIKMYFDHERLYSDNSKTYLGTPKILKSPIVNTKGIPVNKRILEWKNTLNFEYKGKKVTGFIMIRETGSYNQPGIRLLRNKRVIEGTTLHPNKPTTLLGTSNKYGAQRIFGVLNMDDFDVNFMKTGFDDNLTSLYEEIKTLLTESDSNPDLISHASNFRKKLYDKYLNDVTPTQAPEPEGPVPKPTSSPIDPTSADVASQKPLNKTKITKSQAIETRLHKLGNLKLIKLYSSICIVSFVEHPVLIYVGAWSFLESLATNLGKDKKTNFEAFYNNKINIWVDKKSSLRDDFKESIKDINGKGNCNKHAGEYQTIDALQLENDFLVLKPFITMALDKCIEKKEKNDCK